MRPFSGGGGGGRNNDKTFRQNVFPGFHSYHDNTSSQYAFTFTVTPTTTPIIVPDSRFFVVTASVTISLLTVPALLSKPLAQS